MRIGDIARALVVHVGGDHVLVELGDDTRGSIALHEFADAEGVVRVDVGDEIDVFLEGREPNRPWGMSKEKADRLRNWDEIAAACTGDEPVEGTITARVKGGFAVTLGSGVKAFLPGSQTDVRPLWNLDALIGTQHRFRVIKLNKQRAEVVVSRRALLEEERVAERRATLDSLKAGQVVEGVVTGITPYGAFVDLGGIDGLLPIEALSGVTHPSEVLRLGDTVRVRVAELNRETARISLALEPW